MDRPQIIYLDQSILLHGTEVNHTKVGLEYLIEHYHEMLALPGMTMTEEVKKHYIKKIEQYQKHLELYNKQA